MGLGKVLLGAAIGVGAVAAAPFTGGGSLLAGASLAGSLTGAATVAVAAGAGTLGAVSGAVINEMEEEEREAERHRAKERGFEDGYTEGQIAAMERVNEILKDVRKRDDFLIALTAVCYAVANCDGEISSEELDELDYYLNVIKNNSTLPPAVKGQLTRVKNAKAPFNKVTRKLDRVDIEDLDAFEEIIENIVQADDYVAPEELDVLEEWRAYYERRSRQ